ncbi:MAG: hypothetical protein AB8B55_18285 [Mariniblastus sp.]
MNKPDESAKQHDDGFATSLASELSQCDRPVFIDSEAMTNRLIKTRIAKSRGVKRIRLFVAMALISIPILNTIEFGSGKNNKSNQIADSSSIPENPIDTPIALDTDSGHPSKIENEPDSDLKNLLLQRQFIAESELRIATLKYEIANLQKLQQAQQRSFLREELSRTMFSQSPPISAIKF